MTRILLALVAALAVAGTAAAQEEDDPFALDDDPFADVADPFAALEANVSEAQTSLETAAATVTETAGAATGAGASPTPSPEPAAATPAAPAPSGGDDAKDTPGFGLVAALAAVGLAVLLAARRR